jgi:hypothetical protein
MQSRSSLIGVNVTSNPDLRDSCWTSTIGKYRRIHAAPRIGPMKSASRLESRGRTGTGDAWPRPISQGRISENTVGAGVGAS